MNFERTLFDQTTSSHYVLLKKLLKIILRVKTLPLLIKPAIFSDLRKNHDKKELKVLKEQYGLVKANVVFVHQTIYFITFNQTLTSHEKSCN
jgi:hypothetical protein